MQIDDIQVKRSSLPSEGNFIMNIELMGFRFTGYFNDMEGYLLAVSEASRFFMVKLGKINNEQAKLTREVRSH